jgi:diphosphomevalonate decarboxylase
VKSSTAIAHPNIALIKYWGKSSITGNIPAMSSISLTVDALESKTKISFPNNLNEDTWILNGSKQSSLERIKMPFNELIKRSNVRDACLIESDNNFPTAAGLASSASGIASLVTALSHALELELSLKQMIELTMLGSGSAPRSLFSGFVSLDVAGDTITCNTILEGNQWPLEVIICVTSFDQKEISSRVGMEISRKTSPLYNNWVDNHQKDFQTAMAAIQSRKFTQLGTVTIDNCLKLHQVMKTSHPSIDYWNETTHAVVQQVQTLQARGREVFYTIDAGPQVKIICQPDLTEEVVFEINKIAGIKSIIECGLGSGARLINA